MQPSENFRLQLKIGVGSFQTLTNIIWGGFKIDGKQEKGQQFLRDKITGGLTFCLTDFEALESADIETEFTLKLQKQVGSTWVNIPPMAKFYKHDLRINPRAKQATLGNFDSFDLYDTFLAAYNKEINLYDSAPAKSRVRFQNQGVIQVAYPGSNLISNFVEGYYYELPCQPITTSPNDHEKMLETFGFGVYKDPGTGLNDWIRGFVQGTGEGLEPDISGLYKCQDYAANDNWLAGTGVGFKHETNALWIEYDVDSPPTVIVIDAEIGTPSNTLYKGVQGEKSVESPYHRGNGTTLTSETDPNSKTKFYAFKPYVRLLTNKEAVNGESTVCVGSLGLWESGTNYREGDIVTYNGTEYKAKQNTTDTPTNTDSWEQWEGDPFPHGQFKRALPLSTNNFIYTDLATSSPTQWPKVAEDSLHFAGYYFEKPDPVTDYPVLPVLPNTWSGVSSWFYLDDDLKQLLQDASETVIIEDAYKLADALKVVLRDAGAGVAYAENTSHSDFFHSNGFNPIRGAKKIPIIIPMSNVTIGQYDNPAKKTPLRLAEIMQLFEFFYNCYPYIREVGLGIEHFDFFDKGHSYVSEQIGLSLIGIQNPQTSLPWLHGQEEYFFEKESLPERIETGWAANCSTPFNGLPIDILSRFVQKGEVRQAKPTRFYSDLGFALNNPDSMPSDSFLIVECEENDTYFDVIFENVEMRAGEVFRLQNGTMSFAYAQQNYLLHGLPASRVRLNGEEITAESVQRSKFQIVDFPTLGKIASVGTGEIDKRKLITTQQGNGRIVEMSKTLDGGHITAKLAFKID